MGVITFNGVLSTDLNISVQHPPEYAAPQRNYEVTHVPGRNGDIVIDTGSYENVERTYDCAIVKDSGHDYTETMGRVVSWLHSAAGYARLEDTYEPDYYRMAYVQDALTISNLFMTAGVADVTFMCKPQRFLKSGETPVTMTNLVDNMVSITNPTGFNAKPLLFVASGTGSIYFYDSNQVETGVVELLANTGDIYIDCVLKDAYSFDTPGGQAVNRNADIALNAFPEFSPGENFVKTTGTIDTVIVTPNWWTL